MRRHPASFPDKHARPVPCQSGGLNGIPDALGQASFGYTSSVPGTDTIVASFIDNSGREIQSNVATKLWQGDIPVPEFPAVILPAGLLVALLLVVIHTRRK